jgi:hypothetical protein
MSINANIKQGGNMIKATVETIDSCFDVVVLACRIDDDYLLVQDVDENWVVPRQGQRFWINPDYVVYH